MPRELLYQISLYQSDTWYLLQQKIYWYHIIYCNCKGMEINKSKCKILHLGWNNTRHKWSALKKGIQGCWSAAALKSQQRALAAKRANPILWQTQHDQPGRRGDYPAVFSFGATSAGALCAGLGPTSEDVKVLECIQGRAIKLVEGLEGMSCDEWLRALCLSGLEKWRLWGNLIAP